MTGLSLDDYGCFNTECREYILRNPASPRPWQHMLSNDDYLLAISQWGSGYSVYQTIHTNTVTQRVWPKDDAGRFFYIRNAETGDVWSPTLWPTHTTPAHVEGYQCRYGHGYMCWEMTHKGVRSKLTATVALSDPVELYILELENLSGSKIELDIFSYLEWAFEGAPRELGGALHSYFDNDMNCQIGELRLPPQYRAKQIGFLTCDQAIEGFDGWRESFLGSPGNISMPAAVQRGKCGNKVGPIIGNSCGAIQTHIEIPAGSTKKIHFVIGIVNEKNKIPELINRYCDEDSIVREIKKIKNFWFDKLSGFELEGPDKAMLNFANTWLKYQLVQNCRWTRWASDKGYRDVLQDASGMRLIDQKDSKKMLVTMAGEQRSDGHAPRQCSITPWRQQDWRDYRDSCFWLIFALEKYLKETGEFEILSQDIGFCDNEEQASLFEHADRAIEFLWNNRGQHGLCLIAHGDWLDSLNAVGLEGKGESVWLTQAACYALAEMERIALVLNREDDSRRYSRYRTELSNAVNTTGWDGKWYLMAYDDNGTPIGSHSCPDGGKIFLNPQSWGILSGTADSSRAKQSLAAVEEMLSSQYGPLCFAPMYKSFDPTVGRISLWPSEGASAYCHAVAFKIVADCMIGDGDTAWQTLRSITPASGEVDLSESGAEPFCYTNSFAGPSWPHPGRSYTGWWTGTASWAAQIIVEWIYGARADYKGLLIDPCLPNSWKNAKIVRPFRGNTYDISIHKPAGICKGKVSLTIDGKSFEGNLISFPPQGRTYNILCEIN